MINYNGTDISRKAVALRRGRSPMRVAADIVYDQQTQQWCVGMVAPPWVASCGRTPAEAKQKFAEALRAYFDAPAVSARGRLRPKGRVQRIDVA